jgi:hypothetical protein
MCYLARVDDPADAEVYAQGSAGAGACHSDRGTVTLPVTLTVPRPALQALQALRQSKPLLLGGLLLASLAPSDKGLRQYCVSCPAAAAERLLRFETVLHAAVVTCPFPMLVTRLGVRCFLHPTSLRWRVSTCL